MKKPSGSGRDKTQRTAKRNKWTQGSYFNKQINRLTASGMSLLKARSYARSKREE